MCGRYSLDKDPSDDLRQYFPGIKFNPVFEFRSNIDVRPSQSVPVVISIGESIYCSLLRWGLIFSWSQEESPKLTPINARSEILRTKNESKPSFRQKRCIVPINSFYEWHTPAKQEKKSSKTLYRFYSKEFPLLLLAGLWDTRNSSKGPIQSFAIVTTTSNRSVSPVHERMPVILSQDSASDWMNTNRDPVAYIPLFQPASQLMLEKEIIDPSIFSLSSNEV